MLEDALLPVLVDTGTEMLGSLTAGAMGDKR